MTDPSSVRSADVGHGDVWWADLDKVRPVVVLTRRRVAPLLTRVLVAPVTSTVRGVPTEVRLGPDEGVMQGCVANLDNVELLPVGALLKRAGTVSAARWPEFCRAMAAVLSC